MIPFEALLPYAVMFSFITVGGGAMSVFHAYRNDWKRDRLISDKWEAQLIERDFRLTGKVREQSDNAIAPEVFKTNSWWKAETQWQ